MNYQAHYDALMTRARDRVLNGYCERHHVLPRCLGGGDEPTNIVVLTPEEHYVAHQLLVKVYPKIPGIAYAANLMSARCTGGKSYGWLRRRVSETRKGKPLTEEHRKKLVAAKLGKKRGYRKTYPPSAETRAKQSAALLGRKHSAEHNAKVSASMLGKKRGQNSAERNAKASAALKGVPWSAARRACLENRHGA